MPWTTSAHKLRINEKSVSLFSLTKGHDIMAKNKQTLPSDVKQGACGLCLGASNKKRVWAVDCPAITGYVCDDHMELLVKKQNGNKNEPEATLLERAS